VAYTLVFDKKILKQLRKQDGSIKSILTKLFDKLEQTPFQGKLLDVHFQLYELKIKRPPLRLYYRIDNQEVKILEIETKTSSNKQEKTINRLKTNVRTGIFLLLDIFLKLKQTSIQSRILKTLQIKLHTFKFLF